MHGSRRAIWFPDPRDGLYAVRVQLPYLITATIMREKGMLIEWHVFLTRIKISIMYRTWNVNEMERELEVEDMKCI